MQGNGAYNEVTLFYRNRSYAVYFKLCLLLRGKHPWNVKTLTGYVFVKQKSHIGGEKKLIFQREHNSSGYHTDMIESLDYNV